MISDNINNEDFFAHLERLLKDHGIDDQADTSASLLIIYLGNILDAVQALNYSRDVVEDTSITETDHETRGPHLNQWEGSYPSGRLLL